MAAPLLPSDTTLVNGDRRNEDSASADRWRIVQAWRRFFSDLRDLVNTNTTNIATLNYSTGSWTPGIAFGGAATGITYGARAGTYTRVGNMVHIAGSVTLTAVGSSTGQATVTSLPFTITSSAARGSIVLNQYTSLASITGAISMAPVSSGTSINFLQGGAASSTGLTNTNFSATSVINFGGWYYTA